jgi:hypothetical protein
VVGNVVLKLPVKVFKSNKNYIAHIYVSIRAFPPAVVTRPIWQSIILGWHIGVFREVNHKMFRIYFVTTGSPRTPAFY